MELRNRIAGKFSLRLWIRIQVGSLLCKYRGHNMQYSTSGMAGYCKRQGCGYYWEYD